MTVPAQLLQQLCPMHVVLDSSGIITQAGATLSKLETPELIGAAFLEVFEVYRPRSITSMEQLLATEGRKLHIRLRNPRETQLKGMLISFGAGGAVINMSFGISVIDAVRDYGLTNTDFAITDLTIEMLYLVEAKSAALNASLHLNTRLQGAKTEAEERSYTDGLTGLRNRRAMDRVLLRMCKTSQTFSLMHLDLDFFKQVNDTYGHAAGDLVLKKVSEDMLNVTRKDDTVARVGGDEFVILIPNLVNRDRLADLAKTLIERIEEPVEHAGQTYEISASIGISLNHADEIEPEVILEQADIALYASKRAGKAQHCFFDPLVHTAESGANQTIAGE